MDFNRMDELNRIKFILRQMQQLGIPVDLESVRPVLVTRDEKDR
jgi:hypothetical protein